MLEAVPDRLGFNDKRVPINVCWEVREVGLNNVTYLDENKKKNGSLNLEAKLVKDMKVPLP